MFLDGEKENGEGVSVAVSELPLLLPNADGFGAEGRPNTAGGDVDVDADSAPNPPPALLRLVLLLRVPSTPNEESFPKTGSAPPGDPAVVSVQNPLVDLLLLLPENPGTDGVPPPVPRVEGLPKTGAECTGTALLFIRVDELPNSTGAAIVELDVDNPSPTLPLEMFAEVL